MPGKKILFQPEPLRDEEGSLEYYEDLSRKEAFQGFLDSPVWKSLDEFVSSRRELALQVVLALGSDPDKIRFYQGYLQAYKDLIDYLRLQAEGG